MQPELPWNVAGIPAEAREAARAAARREGLSVGEWMTRRILRGFGDSVTEANPSWRPSLVESAPAMPDTLHSPHESEEMLARVSRSEAEAQNAYKALDQQLRTVARRLETAERNQTENNRAMTQAATQINIAAREQAQAFDQMAANVTALAERLVRLERHSQNDGLKDAVKALHQGLSRLADQIAQTANQSASQIAALAGNVDSLTTQVVETSERTGIAAQAMDAHTQTIDTRLASMDERLRVAERTAFSSASALDHTMENVERLRALNDSLEADIHQQGASAGQMKDTLDQLNERISASENEQRMSAARMEESIAKLEAQGANERFEDRLKGLEHTLSEITHRLEYAEYSNASTTAKAEQTLQELSAGFETADRRNRETIGELEIALRDATAKIAAVEDKVSTAHAIAEAAHMTAEATAKPAATEPAPVEVAPPPQPAQPILDMPPFAENPFEPETAHDFVPLPEEHHDFSPVDGLAADLPPSAYGPEDMFTPDVEPPAFGDPMYPEPSSDSFIAAARRSANVAAAQAEQGPGASMGGFAWTFTGKGPSPAESKGKRYALAASIFGVAVTAALAGVVLSRGVGSQPMHAPAAIVSPYAHAPSPQPARGSAGRSTEPDTSADDEAAPATPKAAVSAPAATAASSQPQAATAQPPSTAMQAIKIPAALPAAAPAAGVAQSPQFEKLAALAKSGDSRGQLLLGLKFLEGSGVAVNEAEAARWLARAAQQGEPFAQYRLGTLYERGRGVAADAKLAAHWYELAAKQGNRKAMHNLAVSFAEGSGAAKDPVQAAMWFARAANFGLADSQFNLAVLYERGMGVKQSLTDAYKWYLIAAAQGDSESKSRADALATQLSDTDRAAAQQAAAAFKPQQANPAANSIPVLG